MADIENAQHIDIHALEEMLESGVSRPVRRQLNSLSGADCAHLLTSLPQRQRNLLWPLIDEELKPEVLAHLPEDIRQYYIVHMDADELAELIEELDTDDLADLLQELPEAITQQVLQSLEDEDRQRVEQVMAFEEDSAGGLMNTDVISVRPTHTLDVVLRYLRRFDELPPMTDSLMVINRQEDFIGVLPLSRILISDPELSVRELMDTDIEAIPADMPSHEVAELFARDDLVSAPVVDIHGKLLGRITIDDAVDVMRDEADHSLLASVGLDEEEDTFAPARKAAKGRAIWLGINLITAFIASAVIGLFDATIEKVVALAILMPVVASMGGIAGSQTLTLIIRGMALGQINPGNASWLLRREVVVSLLNGVLWALVIAAVAVAWFKDPTIGIVIGAAIVINLLAAALAGALIPQILKKMNIDPALAGGVILTTVTDVVGFMAFLGLATLFYA